MLKEKELTNVPGLNPEDVVVIKKMSYGQSARLSDKMINLGVQAEVVRNKPKENLNANVKFYELKIYTLLYGLKSAPFYRLDASSKDSAEVQKLKCIDELEKETGDFLFKEINNLNNSEAITDEVEKKSEESSEEEVKETPSQETS